MVPRSAKSRDYFADEGLPCGVVDFHALTDVVGPEKLFHHLDRVDLEGIEKGTKLLDREMWKIFPCPVTDLQRGEYYYSVCVRQFFFPSQSSQRFMVKPDTHVP